MFWGFLSYANLDFEGVCGRGGRKSRNMYVHIVIEIIMYKWFACFGDRLRGLQSPSEKSVSSLASSVASFSLVLTSDTLVFAFPFPFSLSVDSLVSTLAI